MEYKYTFLMPKAVHYCQLLVNVRQQANKHYVLGCGSSKVVTVVHKLLYNSLAAS